MTPDPSPPGGAALRLYQGYRYTIVTIANGATPHPIEAEPWYAAINEDGTLGRWTYFRRYASERAGERLLSSHHRTARD